MESLSHANQFVFIGNVLSESFPVMYAQFNSNLTSDLINAAIANTDFEASLDSAPLGSATLNMMEWIQIIGTAAQIVGVALQWYVFKRQEGKSHKDAEQEALMILQNQPQISKLEDDEIENIKKALHKALNEEMFQKNDFRSK